MRAVVRALKVATWGALLGGILGGVVGYEHDSNSEFTVAAILLYGFIGLVIGIAASLLVALGWARATRAR